MNRILSATLATTAIVLTPACAQDQVNTADKEAIEEIVHNYILDNPEIIEEAIIRLTERQRAEAQESKVEAILANMDAIYEDEADYSIGPADAPITLVEFFDYRCGYCKSSTDWIMALPEKYDNKVRVVFKDMPILSAESEKAALAALAAGRQGKYIEMHLELMELDNKSGFTPDEIDRVAAKVGIDVARMRADMASLEVQAQVANSKGLARTIGLEGTPNFLLGTINVEGANTDYLEQLIESELQKLS
jgi:protein-disulfide isomerase